VFLAGGALLIALSAVLAIGLFDDFGPGVSMSFFYACLFAFGLVPFLFLAGLVRGRWIRGQGLGALVRRLGQAQPAGGLRDELARALGDPSVELAYWLPESEQYVDADGRAVSLPPSRSDRAVTEVEREGQRIAAIVHDPALLDEVEQVRAAGAAAALALANERLEAELRANVEELRASRARIVESSDEARRRIERDLHDGAQQRLVSLALNLAMLRSKMDGDPESARELDAARSELDQALDELRELARGIHPSVLSDRGLEAAVDGPAQRAPLPVEVERVAPARLPDRIESAAYFVIAEALTNVAKYARATHASVSLTCDDARVLLEVTDDGVGGADPAIGSGLRGLLDRVSALGGTLDVDSRPGAGTTVRAVIPLHPMAAARPGLRWAPRLPHRAELGSGTRRRLIRPVSAPNRLAEPEHVALAVPKPRAALAAALARVVALDVSDPLDRPEPGEVVFLEYHATGSQLTDGRLDVVDLPAHLGVSAGRRAGRLEEGELARRAHVAQTAFPLLDGLDSELLRIEGTRPLEVLGRQARCHSSIAKHLVLPVQWIDPPTLRRRGERTVTEGGT
jgi:signal transduction histidine kinase